MNGDIDFRIDQARTEATALGLTVRFIRHQISGRSTSDAERALGISSDGIVKSLILVEGTNGEFHGFILLGCSRLDIRRAMMESNTTKLKFASPKQIFDLTGYQIGGVPPMALRRCRTVTMDRRVFEKQLVIGAGGDEHCGMEFSPRQLAAAIGAKVGEIT